MLQRSALLALALAVVVTPAFAAMGPPRRLTSSGPGLSALPVWQEEATLLPTGDAVGDLYASYGSAVAADGDTVAVGAPGWQGIDADGCVRLYVRSAGAWTQQALLTVPAAQASGFGRQLALFGDTLAVASSGYQAGGVFIYVRSGTTWSLQSRIPPATVYSSSFGAALALSADTLVVGEPSADTGFGSRSGAAFVYVRTAGAWALEEEVLGFEIASEDWFGQSVAVDADTLAVGSPGDSTGVAVGAGSVYLFSRAGGHWTQTLKLIDPAGQGGAAVGQAVALAGTTLAVSAPLESGGAGRVHVYEDVSGTWIPRALVAPTTAGAQRFGASLALAQGATQLLVGFEGYVAERAELFVGSAGAWTLGAVLTPPDSDLYWTSPNAFALTAGTAVVGVPGLRQTGAAWVWTGSGTTWTVEATLDNPGSARFDAFGSAIAIDNSILIVGAPNDDTMSGRRSGAAYVFERTVAGWTPRQKLVPPIELVGASFLPVGFGSSVAVSGDRLVVGAPGARQGGRVLAYARVAGVWTSTGELAATDEQLLSQFGGAVALRGARLLVGTPQADLYATTGAVYAFEEAAGQWSQRQKLVLPSSPEGGRFGSALAISPSGTRVLAGAPGVNSAGMLTLASGLWTIERVVSTSSPGYSSPTATRWPPATTSPSWESRRPRTHRSSRVPSRSATPPAGCCRDSSPRTTA